MANVWSESSKQAQEMLEYYMDLKAALKAGTKAGETDGTVIGVRSIAINVLAAASYGLSQSWGSDSDAPPSGYKLSFFDTVNEVIQHLVLAAFIPTWMLSLPVMPEKVRRIGFAKLEFPKHTSDMLVHEKTSTTLGGKTSLLSLLAKFSDDAEKSGQEEVTQSLSSTEITGNLFVFSVAGFDTTANTLGYTLTLLASYPEWQDWIVEEIDEVLREHGHLDYLQTFPLLKRCLALMVSTFGISFRVQVEELTECSMKPSVYTLPWPIWLAPRPASNYLHRTRLTSFPQTQSYIPLQWPFM